MGEMQVHGGLDGRELARAGIAAADCLDFSTNVNPYGPPAAAVRAAKRALEGNAYPDRECWRLRVAIADRTGVTPEAVVVGNGSAELIWAVGRVLAPRLGRAVLVDPTFGGYRQGWLAAGGEAERVWAGLDDSKWEEEAVASALALDPARAVFLCSPNNPTGHALDVEAVARRLGHLEYLIVDQAYMNFRGAPSPVPPLPSGERLIVLRSFTKDFGLAGMRLGYLIAEERLALDLRRQLPPWNVNAAAQAAGLACLDEGAFLTDSMQRLRADAALLAAGLGSIGLPPRPADLHFMLVRVGNARLLRARLLERRILIRDCASFGLREHIRVAARPKPDCERLLEALADAVLDLKGERAPVG